MCRAPVTLGGGWTITKLPSSLTLPSVVNSGLKSPSFSHQLYHADSTATGLYALKCGSSKDRIRFFSPTGVSSTYSGSASSSAFFSLSFFSLLAALAARVAALAFFASSFAAFSAFLRSFSTTELVSKWYKHLCRRDSRLSHTFFLAFNLWATRLSGGIVGFGSRRLRLARRRLRQIARESGRPSYRRTRQYYIETYV